MNRTTFDGVAVVVIGDKTSHGGVVLTGDNTTLENGIGMARVGDEVYCPRCKPHIHKIIQGSSNCPTPNGQSIALHNDETSCGATLIAAGAPNINAAISFLTRLEKSETQKYDEQFLVADDEGNTLADMPYTVKLASGELVHGVTDDEGKTERFFTDDAQKLEIHLGHIEE
ncbi:PAAR domain-containing protein [Collimonas silvisoli]|uniref:PAAR domain-containing protein n=1 Tax=Collimonas silvisoli TaxID=2825884 RepID=UPI001B8BF709|nr:PAAR domain-containing protein [Collimonas silvisoli]